MSKIGSLDPEIWAKKWSKSGQIEVSERFFEKISRNMTDTEKMLMSIVVGNRNRECAYLKKKSLKSVQWFRSYGQNSNGLGRYSVFYEGALFLPCISGTISARVTKKILTKFFLTKFF